MEDGEEKQEERRSDGVEVKEDGGRRWADVQKFSSCSWAQPSICVCVCVFVLTLTVALLAAPPHVGPSGPYGLYEPDGPPLSLSLQVI